MPEPVWFWQRIVSPHMVGLAAALAGRGWDVTYVAEQPMSTDRAAQGWVAPDAGEARVRFAPDAEAAEALLAGAPANSVHICQGLRGNGVVGAAQNFIAHRRLAHWIVMETVEEKGCVSSWIKRAEYARLIRQWRCRVEGVLATGYRTPDWLADRGMPRERIFPFAYFLPMPGVRAIPARVDGRYRFLFVGQFIERKRLNLLIEALGQIREAGDFELIVVGSGPLDKELRMLAESRLAGRLVWRGRLSQSEVAAVMAAADCLVLPSRHDGWGAVISEALMSGTRVICSDRCGAAGVVELSQRGGVFRAGDTAHLAHLLRRELAAGRPTREQRSSLADWAACLGAAAGAHYLAEILAWRPGRGRPQPPWGRAT